VPILENQAKNRRVVVKLVRRYTKSVEPTAAGTQDSEK
jgi:hypothetical protein